MQWDSPHCADVIAQSDARLVDGYSRKLSYAGFTATATMVQQQCAAALAGSRGEDPRGANQACADAFAAAIDQTGIDSGMENLPLLEGYNECVNGTPQCQLFLPRLPQPER
jgi:hypothetical protein